MEPKMWHQVTESATLDPRNPVSKRFDTVFPVASALRPGEPKSGTFRRPFPTHGTPRLHVPAYSASPNKWMMNGFTIMCYFFLFYFFMGYAQVTTEFNGIIDFGEQTGENYISMINYLVLQAAIAKVNGIPMLPSYDNNQPKYFVVRLVGYNGTLDCLFQIHDLYLIAFKRGISSIRNQLTEAEPTIEGAHSLEIDPNYARIFGYNKGTTIGIQKINDAIFGLSNREIHGEQLFDITLSVSLAMSFIPVRNLVSGSFESKKAEKLEWMTALIYKWEKLSLEVIKCPNQSCQAWYSYFKVISSEPLRPIDIIGVLSGKPLHHD